MFVLILLLIIISSYNSMKIISNIGKTDYTNSIIQNKLKSGFHERNKHKYGYDFNLLIDCHEDLQKYIVKSKYGNYSIDFSNSFAVKSLNFALLKTYYNVSYWDIPDNYLCPPIPSRVDYIHNIADLIIPSNMKNETHHVKGLDIGIGANCIYPILGVSEYNWDFVGTECDETSINAAVNIINSNQLLQNRIEIRKQSNKNNIFNGIILDSDSFDFCCCNPPFHNSMEIAMKGSERKWNNLKINNKSLRTNKKFPKLNFGGISSELSYEHGGEIGFVSNMIKESSDPFIHNRIKLFTTLISSQENLYTLYKILERMPDIKNIDVVEMEHGNKKSRILTWKY